MSSLDRILPFLKPIEDLLRDPAVTEVMVNDGTVPEVQAGIHKRLMADQ